MTPESFVQKVEWILNHKSGFEMRSCLSTLVAEYHAGKKPTVVGHSVTYAPKLPYYGATWLAKAINNAGDDTILDVWNWSH